MNDFLSKTIDYLKIKVPDFKIESRGVRRMFTCPFCSTPYTCSFVGHPQEYKMTCTKVECTRPKSGSWFNLFDIIRFLEGDKKDLPQSDIEYYLKELFQLDILTTKDIDNIFNFYEANGFDLVPIAKNSKIPIESGWTTKEHKDKVEWKKWLELGINIGVKTGRCSNITVVDIDQKPIPPEVDKIKGNCVIQETNKGFHLFYKYDPDLPKTRIESFKIDIENDGGQVVIFPSTVEGIKRIISGSNIEPIPNEFKQFLKQQLLIPNVKTFSEQLTDDIQTENFKLDVINTGTRHNVLMHIGGILRKQLNSAQTGFVLEILNSKFCSPSLTQLEISNVNKSLERYITFDEKEMAFKILNYVKIIEEASSRDIREALGYKKEDIDKALNFLVREGFLIKRRRLYHVIKKANWKEEFPNYSNEIPFIVPYFQDTAFLRWGDMLLLGSKTKWGKTTISMNFVKSFVDQGYKPYYMSLESGSRFIQTALTLGMRPGQFYWDFVADPTKIELEPNAITIIDWLCIEDKATTDVVFKYFVEQLFKTNGFLIVFMQLKENADWFAPNMVKQFPALAAKYLYDIESDGSTGKWIVDPIREPKRRRKIEIIPCRYDWENKTLIEINQNTMNEVNIDV